MCTTCGKKFSRPDGLKRHNQKPCCKMSEKKFHCVKCKVTFNRTDNLKRHMLKCKKHSNTEVVNVNKSITNKKVREVASTSSNEKLGGGNLLYSDVKQIETSFKGRLRTFEILNNNNVCNPQE
jgi:uncharacterized Zn-finger protein